MNTENFLRDWRLPQLNLAFYNTVLVMPISFKRILKVSKHFSCEIKNERKFRLYYISVLCIVSLDPMTNCFFKAVQIRHFYVFC